MISCAAKLNQKLNEAKSFIKSVVMCRYKDIFKFTIYVEYLQKFMHRY